ncbi:hypothetical protein [Cellulomonas gelida]|uniref:Uncharacterized protein n=1 Tax=Cellulomonas gelida TaxID=1712 RepID=A0A4Y3KLD0_9CELL|nr:hypothetical protein [Cellulomonas gelida]GEA85221.1 hypothetical protein CGE01nite_24720 [Cellulomonas gelida]GGL21329.1 hypothetical protein GCM10009774_09550 [Cellulomonas gelida]
MTRDPWSVLVDVAPAAVDPTSLDRARARVEADRREVVSLGRARRRTRRVVLVAGLSVAAAALAVVVPVLGRGETETPSPVARILGVIPAAAVGENCSNQQDPVPGPADPDRPVARDQWARIPAVRGLLHLVGDRVPEHSAVSSGPGVCDAIPVAVLHDEPGRRGIVVYRDVTEPFRGVGPTLDDATVRGFAAHVLSPPAGHHYVAWTDDDGIRWFVEANGMTVPELVATLDSALDDTGLAAVPDDYVAVPVPPHDPTGTVYRWTVQYDEGGYVYLEVTSPARTPVDARASWPGEQEYTTVAGVRALYLPQEQGGAGLRWSTADASYRLVVAGADLAQLREIAEHLEPVSPDDPRLPAR